MSEAPVRSPCVNVCALDIDDLCIGCYRTMDEIVRWSSMSNDERRDVVRMADQRYNERHPPLI